jgi:hypothetical protein
MRVRRKVANGTTDPRRRLGKLGSFARRASTASVRTTIAYDTEIAARFTLPRAFYSLRIAIERPKVTFYSLRTAIARL